MYALTVEQKQRIKLWVEALRSGKYKQATGYLREKHSFCCLGVACDLSGLAEWEFYGAGRAEYLLCDRTLPGDVIEYYGLIDSPFVKTKTSLGTPSMERLTELNDSGMCFENIANLIEETYLGE